jgi:hypothetical protein
MNIISNEELSLRLREAFRNGVLVAAIATGATAALYFWLHRPAPASAGTPQIVRQTPSQTVARIPTLHAGVRVDCTVTIDQAKNVWSITC